MNSNFSISSARRSEIEANSVDVTESRGVRLPGHWKLSHTHLILGLDVQSPLPHGKSFASANATDCEETQSLAELRERGAPESDNSNAVRLVRSRIDREFVSSV